VAVLLGDEVCVAVWEAVWVDEEVWVAVCEDEDVCEPLLVAVAVRALETDCVAV
jgi:hypothetical protein